MTKKNILVFPCGSEIGLEIQRSLKFSIHFELFGGSSVDDHGKFIYRNYIDDIPDVRDSNFIETVNSVVSEYSIDFIIPAHDSVILKLAQEKQRGNLSCELITSPLHTCEIARSKLKTYELFKDVIPTPMIHKTVDELVELDLPIFLKPDVGQGSKGTYLAKTFEEIHFYRKKDPSLLMLEFLPGIEYTVDCFTNKDGELLFCEGRERVRVLNGISVNTVTVKDERFINLATKINQTLEFRGVWFFQLKENSSKELILMEIAPRVAGTMALIRAKGANLVLASLFDALGYKLDILSNDYNIVIDRALENTYKHDIHYSHVYLDFDDLLILEDKVNPAIMAFIYQCFNKGIKVHLITRHRHDLDSSLEKYRLKGLFDELIWVKDDDEKHHHIKEKDAIFIDDSFAERKKVKEMCGIPAFDGHMVEALMERF